MLTLSSAAIVEKNKLASSGAWLVLLEINLPGGSNILRVVNNTENVTWAGEEWVAFPFEIDDMTEDRAGEVPQINLRVSNITKAIQIYLEQNEGGVRSEVILRVVHSDHLDLATAEAEFVFECLACSADASWITFTLGTANPFRRRFPRRRLLSEFCNWTFKGAECGYTGATTTCNKTLTTCRALNNTARFGGFPGVGRRGFYA